MRDQCALAAAAPEPAPEPDAGGSLPYTGNEPTPLWLTAFALVAIGTLTVAGTRRRRAR